MNNFIESLTNKTLNLIFDMVEKNYDYLDVDFEDQNLKIEKDEKIFIVSIHNPTSQIWLSSPISEVRIILNSSVTLMSGLEQEIKI